MKTTTLAGALLVLALAGCAMPDSSPRSSMNTNNHSQADPANYHAANFGDPDNQPFDGTYSANW